MINITHHYGTVIIENTGLIHESRAEYVTIKDRWSLDAAVGLRDDLDAAIAAAAKASLR